MSKVIIRDVVKRYGQALSVDHLNLKIESGEIFGLLGPNGAGKSTTIKMLSGLLRIDQGDITVDGLSVARNTLDVKRQIGLVPQDLAIYEALSARENVTFFAKLYGLRGADLKARVNEALAFVGLEDRQHDKASSFSGGMKRRLNIACAITHAPKLIILDEPTVGIDPQSRNHILESVKELKRRGSTIIYTSHYMEEVEAISDRVGIMDRGRLIALGTKDELKQQAQKEEKLTVQVDVIGEQAIEELKKHPQIRAVIVSGAVLELVMASSQAYLQDILFILSKHGSAIRSIMREETGLEALFLELTGRTLRD